MCIFKTDSRHYRFHATARKSCGNDANRLRGDEHTFVAYSPGFHSCSCWTCNASECKQRIAAAKRFARGTAWSPSPFRPAPPRRKLNGFKCFQGRPLSKVRIVDAVYQGGQRSLLETQRYPTARFSPLAIDCKFVDSSTSSSVSSPSITKTMEAAAADYATTRFTFTLVVTKNYIRTTSRASYFFAHSLFTFTNLFIHHSTSLCCFHVAIWRKKKFSVKW